MTTAQALAAAVEGAGLRFTPLEPGADLDLRQLDTLFPEREAEPPGPACLAFDFKRVFIDTMPAQAQTLGLLSNSEVRRASVASQIFTRLARGVLLTG